MKTMRAMLGLAMLVVGVNALSANDNPHLGYWLDEYPYASYCPKVCQEVLNNPQPKAAKVELEQKFAPGSAW